MIFVTSRHTSGRITHSVTAYQLVSSWRKLNWIFFLTSRQTSGRITHSSVTPYRLASSWIFSIFFFNVPSYLWTNHTFSHPYQLVSSWIYFSLRPVIPLDESHNRARSTQDESHIPSYSIPVSFWTFLFFNDSSTARGHLFHCPSIPSRIAKSPKHK